MGRGAFEHRYRGRSIGNLDLARGRVDRTPALVHRSGVTRPAPSASSVELFCADNRLLLEAKVSSWGESFDLIYVDPPFASGKSYQARVGGTRSAIARKVLAYDDDREFEAYLDWLEARLILCRELLRPSGSLYVHLDWRAVHHVKVRLDRIFGRNRFLNEIIWCYHGPNPIKSAFKRKHDTILVYTKSADYFFDADAVRVPYDPATVKTFRASSKAGFGKVPDLARGKVPEDWWYFPVVARLHHERVGYETQKPLALVERIVRASSPPGGRVGDFFAGSGTTAVAAIRNGRSAIACDSSSVAIGKTVDRIEAEQPAPPLRVYRFRRGDRRED